jgi:hypothetical protein
MTSPLVIPIINGKFELPLHTDADLAAISVSEPSVTSPTCMEVHSLDTGSYGGFAKLQFHKHSEAINMTV